MRSKIADKILSKTPEYVKQKVKEYSNDLIKTHKMKTPIQQLIEKYNDHLKHDDDLDSLSGRDILKIVLVDLISYQVKEQEAILDACKHGFQVDAEDDCWLGDDEQAKMYYNKTFKQD